MFWTKFNGITYRGIYQNILRIVLRQNGTVALKGEGHFHFTKVTSIGKSSSPWETFEPGHLATTRANEGHG